MASSPHIAAIAYPSNRRIAAVTALAWLVYIGLDFLLNAGLLANVIDWHQPGLLTPMQLFVRIPFGYLSFLAATVLMVWIMLQIGIRDPRSGALFGLKFGSLIGAAGFLGLLSILSIRPRDILLWSLETLVSATFLGAIVGEGFRRESLRKMTVAIILFVLVSFIIAAFIQNLTDAR